MSMFFYCKNAELPHPITGAPVPAQVCTAPTGGLLVTAPRDPEFPLRVPVLIHFLDPIQGVVRCRCILSSPLVTDDHRGRSYRCEVLERLSQEQRREDIKIPLSVKVTAVLESSRPRREASATLVNISAGGVYLLTQLQARPGDQLSFFFHEAGGSILLSAEVLRAEDRVDHYSRPIRGYGCRFVRLPQSHEAQLRRYVFKEEKRLFQKQ